MKLVYLGREVHRAKKNWTHRGALGMATLVPAAASDPGDAPGRSALTLGSFPKCLQDPCVSYCYVCAQMSFLWYMGCNRIWLARGHVQSHMTNREADHVGTGKDLWVAGATVMKKRKHALVMAHGMIVDQELDGLPCCICMCPLTSLALHLTL